MELVQRRFVYTAFFLAFFIATPLIIGYSLGYRLDIQTWQLTKVGAFFVKSYPDNATIYLNDQRQRARTPNQLINVTPGVNELTVTRDSYMDWEKELTVEPGRTTFVEDILLFKSEIKSSIVGPGSAGDPLVKNGRALFFNRDGELFVVSAQNQDFLNLGQLENIDHLYDWNEGTRLIGRTTSGDVTIYLAETGEKISLQNLFTRDIRKAIFYSDDTILVLNETGLYSVSADTLNPTLLAQHVVDVALSNSTIYTISNDWKLQSFRLNEDSADQKTLAVAPESHFGEIRADRLVLQNQNSITLIVGDAIVAQIAGSDYDWRGDQLLVYNDVELRIVDSKTGASRLIDRTGSRKQRFLWHPSMSYFTRIADGQATIVEIDNRGNKRHEITVADAQTTTDTLIYDRDGESFILITPTATTHYIIQ